MKHDETLQLDKNSLGEEWNYGDFASGVFQAALQILEDYIDLAVKVIVKETACILRCATFPEFTAWFYPKEE